MITGEVQSCCHFLALSFPMSPLLVASGNFLDLLLLLFFLFFLSSYWAWLKTATGQREHGHRLSKHGSRSWLNCRDFC